MSSRRPEATFNIGSQQGVISNVAGDMTVVGGQQYVDRADMVRQELLKLREALSTLNLDSGTATRVTRCLADVQDELEQPQPRAEKIGSALERATAFLKEAGAIAVAGAAVIDPLQRIASWLGASGQALLRLIA